MDLDMAESIQHVRNSFNRIDIPDDEMMNRMERLVEEMQPLFLSRGFTLSYTVVNTQTGQDRSEP
jgi:hypothetical protein